MRDAVRAEEKTASSGQSRPDSSLGGHRFIFCNLLSGFDQLSPKYFDLLGNHF